jgi:hypothetical protein
MALCTRVYWKPTCIGQYLSFSPNYPLHVERCLMQSSQKSFHHKQRTRSLKKLIAWDMIFSLMVIPTVWSTWLLTPRMAVFQVK